MKNILLAPLTAAPTHSYAQLDAVLNAAARYDHPLSALAILSVRAPNIADVISAVGVNHVYARAGIVLIPTEQGFLHEVGVGTRAMEFIQGLIGDRTEGFLIEDDHGDPVWPDDDASDLVVQDLTAIDPALGTFEWSLYSLRCAAFDHMIASGVSGHLLGSASGLLPLPAHGPSRRIAVLEQQMVGDHWTHLLDFDRQMRTLGPSVTSWALCPNKDSFALFAAAMACS